MKNQLNFLDIFEKYFKRFYKCQIYLNLDLDLFVILYEA
jgi:hypothetical protein